MHYFRGFPIMILRVRVNSFRKEITEVGESSL